MSLLSNRYFTFFRLPLALLLRERRIHEETKLVADKIVATADNMDTVGSHITAKQNELEIQLSKVLKTVVIV